MRIKFQFRPWNELLVGFAPKVDCFNYAVGRQGQKINNAQNGQDTVAPYIVPSYNSSASGIQPCWNSDIWPSCGIAQGIHLTDESNYVADILASGGGGGSMWNLDDVRSWAYN